MLNPRTGKTERIGRLVRMHANKREALEEVPAGDIAAVDRSQEHHHRRHALRRGQPDRCSSKIQFPETVISMSIEPKKRADRDKLSEVDRHA